MSKIRDGYIPAPQMQTSTRVRGPVRSLLAIDRGPPGQMNFMVPLGPWAEYPAPAGVADAKAPAKSAPAMTLKARRGRKRAGR